MKRFLSVICLLLTLCMVLPACGDAVETDGVDLGDYTEDPESESETEAEETEPEAETEAEETEPEEEIYMERTYTMKDAEGLFNPLGRTAMVGTSLTVDWTGAGAAFSAECKGDFKMTFNAGSNSIYLRVEVDGKITKNFKVNKGTGTYVIAEDLEEGLHNIRIVSEPGYGRWNCSELMSVTLTGKLREEKPKDVYIEVIGDSITHGAGLSSMLDGNGKNMNDGTLTYAYVAIDQLDVDYSIMANGGMGFAFAADMENLVNLRYMYQCDKRNTDPYVPTRTPDLIVINLHTNDNYQWYLKKNPDKTVFYEAFDKEVDTLLASIDQLYGEKKVPILFVFGCMATSSYTTATDRLHELIKTKYIPAGYDIETVTLTTDRSGSASHPTVAGAQKQGDELADYIRDTYYYMFR